MPTRFWFSTHAQKVKSCPHPKTVFDNGSSKTILLLRSKPEALEMCGMNRTVIAATRGLGKSPSRKIVTRFLKVCMLKSEFINQIPHTNPEGLGYPQQRVQADPLLSPLDFTDVNRVQAEFFRQLFLTHASLVTAYPDGISQDFKLTRTRHSLSGKQDRRKLETPNMGL
jgi:hypothetical protein